MEGLGINRWTRAEVDSAEQFWVVGNKAILIDGERRLEPGPIHAFEEIEPVFQPGVCLRLGHDLEVMRRHPGHSVLLTLSDLQLAAPYRKAIGKRRGPDVDVDATIEVREVLAQGIAPAPTAVGLQGQGSNLKVFRGF